MINVRDPRHGAVGDGHTVDTRAFRSAIREAYGRRHEGQQSSIYIPAGRYLIAPTIDRDTGLDSGGAILSCLEGSDCDDIPPEKYGQGPYLDYRHWMGLHFQGEGLYSSILVLDTDDAEKNSPATQKWFYDNGQVPRLAFASFADLTFESNDPDRCSAFNLTSDGHEQHFSWHRCRFTQFRTVLKLSGSLGNDSHRFINCNISGVSHAVVHWENSQAGIIEFVATNVENITGDGFRVGQGGGGELRVYGGSFIMDPPDPPTRHWLLTIEPTDRTGPQNCTFLFNGIKTELRSRTSGLVYAPDRLPTPTYGRGTAYVTFTDANLMVTGEPSAADLSEDPIGGLHSHHREVVHVGTGRRVSFVRAALSEKFLYRVDAEHSSAPAWSIGGLIEFMDCRVPENLADNVRFGPVTGGDMPRYGHARAAGCHIFHNLEALEPPKRVACDFDLNWRNQLGGDVCTTVKVALMRTATAPFPYMDRNGDFVNRTEHTLMLPPGAVIKAIHVNKPGNPPQTPLEMEPPYEMLVGSDDKRDVYARSGVHSQNDEHRIGADGLFIQPRTRAIRLWARGERCYNAFTGGWAIVEYL